jgi:hypothetical protein
MDITLPICPAARRWSHTKKTMIRMNGRNRPIVSSQLDEGLLKVASGTFSTISCWSASGSGVGPEVVNFSPLVSSPVIRPLALL